MSWWFDKKAVEQTLKLKEEIDISTYVETGVFRGINIRFWSYYFKEVWGCDISEEYLKIAKSKVQDRNVLLLKIDSPTFLKSITNTYNKMRREDTLFIYLDAHFYDPKLPANEKWVVKNELKALEGFRNCAIAIHDFDCNGLGHLVYDGEHLNFELIKDELSKVNPDFRFYTNTREFCEVHTRESIKGVIGLVEDEETLETIDYHSTDRLKYRGILYCVPRELDLRRYQLICK
ncbi:MAG: hypothetical protein Q8P40_16260 [Nitrospirota bacterium]|nr:hypothetical protein [Nitrospirota bacterium]